MAAQASAEPPEILEVTRWMAPIADIDAPIAHRQEFWFAAGRM